MFFCIALLDVISINYQFHGGWADESCFEVPIKEAFAGVILQPEAFCVLFEDNSTWQVSTQPFKSLIMKSIIVVIILIFLAGCASVKEGHQSFEKYEKPSRFLSNQLLKKIEEGQYGKVEDHFNYLVKEKPYSINGTRLLEEVYTNLSNVRNFEKLLDDWCEKSPHHQSPFVIRGLYRINSAWFARGEGYAYTVSETDSRLFKQHLELAKDDLEKAYSINPDDPNSASSMVIVCTGLACEEEEMEKWFKRAVGADPISYNAYSAKLNYLNPKWLGNHEKFAEFVDYCYQNSPSGSIVYRVKLSHLYEYLGRVATAKKFLNDPLIKNIVNDIYKKVTTDYPNSTSIRADFAYVLYKHGSILDAIHFYTEALEIDPDDTYLLLARGNVNLEKKNDYKKAEIDYKKIIENNPYYTKEYATAYFGLGLINERHYQNYEKAIDFYNKAIEIYPKEKKFFTFRGVLKLGINHDFKSALDDFNEALDLDHFDIFANFYKAKCLMVLDRKDEAIMVFQETLELIRIEEAKGDAGKINKEEAEKLIFEINNNIQYCRRKAV